MSACWVSLIAGFVLLFAVTCGDPGLRRRDPATRDRPAAGADLHRRRRPARPASSCCSSAWSRSSSAAWPRSPPTRGWRSRSAGTARCPARGCGRKVNPRTGTPTNSIWLCVVCSVDRWSLPALWNADRVLRGHLDRGHRPVHRLRHPGVPAPAQPGLRAGPVEPRPVERRVGWTAVVWVVFICVLFMLPPVHRSPATTLQLRARRGRRGGAGLRRRSPGSPVGGKKHFMVDVPSQATTPRPPRRRRVEDTRRAGDGGDRRGAVRAPVAARCCGRCAAATRSRSPSPSWPRRSGSAWSPSASTCRPSASWPNARGQPGDAARGDRRAARRRLPGDPPRPGRRHVRRLPRPGRRRPRSGRCAAAIAARDGRRAARRAGLPAGGRARGGRHLAATRALQRRTGAQRLVAAWRRRGGRGRRRHRRVADSRLHLAIAAAERLAVAGRGGHRRAGHGWTTARRDPGARAQPRPLDAQHRAIVEAILAGDPTAARRAMEEHCDGTAELLRGLLG